MIMRNRQMSIVAAISVISTSMIPFTTAPTARAISKWEMEGGFI